MTPARTAVGLTLAIGLTVAACSVDPDVEVESRRQSSSTTAAPDTSSSAPTAGSPVTTEPTSDDRDQAESQNEPPLPDRDQGSDDTLVLAAGDLTVSVSLRPTIAPPPPGGYDGFAGAIVTPDGALVAHGFDDVADADSPERSALWRSSDGEVWERVGEEVGAPDGQQSIFGIVEVSDGLAAYANELALSDIAGDEGSTPFEFDGISRHHSVDGGRSWVRSEVWPDAFAGLVESGGQTVLLGASNLDSNRPLGSSFVEIDSEPGRFQRHVTDLGSGGFADSGGLLVAGAQNAGALVAVGSSTARDPDRADGIVFADQLLGVGPIDVGIWMSENGGRNWDEQRAEPFAGRAGAQTALDVVDIDGVLWMLVADRNVDGAMIGLHSSADGGASWSMATLDADVGSGRTAGDIFAPMLAGAHLAVLDGAILVTVNSVSLGDAVPRVESILSLFDPATGAVDTRSATAVLDVEQLEAIVAYGGAWIGLGRRERAAFDASDLQAVDIQLDRESAPEPAEGGSDPAA